MQNPRLATRYAKSLLDLSLERGELERVYADMTWLKAVTKSAPEFVGLLRSPVIKGDKKSKIIDAVAGSQLSELTREFIRLLIRKAREGNLPEIITAFVDQYKTHKNIHVVKLTTATPITQDTRQSILDQVKRSAGYENIELVETVDESLIGGFVLQIGDQLVDASVAYDLKTIARQFENNDFIYKIR